MVKNVREDASHIYKIRRAKKDSKCGQKGQATT